MFKSVVFHERLPELSHSEFMDHWLNVHAPMSQGTKDLYGYTCNEVVSDVTPGGVRLLDVAAAVDGIAHMWFKTNDGLVTLPMSQPSVQKWFADGPNFIGRRVRLMGEETVVQQPQRQKGPTPKLAILVAANGSHANASKALATVLSKDKTAVVAPEGLTITRILSNRASARIAGFPMEQFDYVIELWLRSVGDARKAASQLIDILKPNISHVRVFLTLENVIQVPTKG